MRDREGGLGWDSLAGWFAGLQVLRAFCLPKCPANLRNLDGPAVYWPVRGPVRAGAVLEEQEEVHVSWLALPQFIMYSVARTRRCASRQGCGLDERPDGSLGGLGERPGDRDLIKGEAGTHTRRADFTRSIYIFLAAILCANLCRAGHVLLVIVWHSRESDAV